MSRAGTTPRLIGAAKSQVKHDLVILERLVHLALALEDGGRCAPVGGVRVGTEDICGRGAVRPEPDGDEGGRPFGGVDSACGVERRSVCAR